MDHVIRALNSAKSPLHWASFTGFLTLAVVVRLAAFQGYWGSDPRNYSVLANDLANGTLHIPEYDGPPVFPLRLGVYAPVAILIKVFGVSEPTLVAYPFIVSIFGCLVAYAFGRCWGTPLAGLIALGAIAVLPIDVLEASLLLPDAIAAFWASIGIGLACVALNRVKLWQSAFLGIISGGGFGVSWLCKESVVYLVPFVAILIFAVYRHSRLSLRMTCLVAIGVGSLAVLLAETAFYARLTGDPMFHLHATERNYVQCAVWFFDEASPTLGWKCGGYAKALAMRLFVGGPINMILNRSMSFVPAIAILGVAWALLFRRHSLLIPSIWLISLLLMYNFGTSSFSSYKPLPLVDRYLYPIILPSLLLASGFLAMLLAGDSDLRVAQERRFWAVVLIVGFCGMSALGVREGMKSRPNQVERNLAVRLRERDVVYTDHRTAAHLVFFRTGLLLPSTTTTIPWEEEEVNGQSSTGSLAPSIAATVPCGKVDERAIPTGAYVFLNKDMIDVLTRFYNYESPGFVAKPPSTWEKVWSHGNAELYLVGSR